MPRKRSSGRIWTDGTHWSVATGELIPSRTSQSRDESLLAAFGEKLPFDSLAAVERFLRSRKHKLAGIYVAHDSMGTPRYIGRGNIFPRLRKRRRTHPHELVYFSFYTVKSKTHEQEIETLLIRAAGPSLDFNTQKKRVGIRPGRVKDFAPGNLYFERVAFRGRMPKTGTS